MRAAFLLVPGLALLSACSEPAPEIEVPLPASSPDSIVASARDCAAAVSADHTDLVLLHKLGWSENRQQGQQNQIGMPYVTLLKSGGAPQMTIAQDTDGSRICSLASRLADDATFEQVNAAFDKRFGKGKLVDGFYYYYRDPDLMVLSRHPGSPDQQVQVAVIEPSARQLMVAGIRP